MQAPNNVVTYTLSGNAKALEYFQVGSSSGQVSVVQPLYLDTDRTVTYTVSSHHLSDTSAIR